MKYEPTQAETLTKLTSRCEGPGQFKRFDRAFRASLTVSKEQLLKAETRQKRAKAKKRSAKKPS